MLLWLFWSKTHFNVLACERQSALTVSLFEDVIDRLLLSIVSGMFCIKSSWEYKTIRVSCFTTLNTDRLILSKYLLIK